MSVPIRRLPCALLLAAACTSLAPLRPAVPPPDAVILQPGDWILRGGTGADSALIRRLSRSRYSHIGMVVATAPQVVVAHATTDDDPDRPDQVLLTPLRQFLSPDKADAVLVLRPRFLSAVQRRATATTAAAQQGRAFVLTARSENPFYCSHLVLESVRRQRPDFALQWQYLDVAVFRGEYLFPQAFLAADTEIVYRYESGE